MARMMKDMLYLLDALIELDYDAIEAYKAAIERVSEAADKNQIGQFMGDHRRHVSELSLIVGNFGGAPPKHGDLKQLLTKGKVVIGGLVGEKAVFEAMRSNEDDTNAAYEKACNEPGMPLDVLAILERNLADERRHRAWFLRRLSLIAVSPSPPGAASTASPSRH